MIFNPNKERIKWKLNLNSLHIKKHKKIPAKIKKMMYQKIKIHSYYKIGLTSSWRLGRKKIIYYSLGMPKSSVEGEITFNFYINVILFDEYAKNNNINVRTLFFNLKVVCNIHFICDNFRF